MVLKSSSCVHALPVLKQVMQPWQPFRFIFVALHSTISWPRPFAASMNASAIELLLPPLRALPLITTILLMGFPLS